MKKIAVVICLICLCAGLFIGCNDTPTKLAGMTYVGEDMAVKFTDNTYSAEEQAAIKERIQEEKAYLKDSLRLSFKENGVVEDIDHETGTYVYQDGKGYILFDEERLKMEFSDEIMYIFIEETDIVLIYKLVPQ